MELALQERVVKKEILRVFVQHSPTLHSLPEKKSRQESGQKLKARTKPIYLTGESTVSNTLEREWGLVE